MYRNTKTRRTDYVAILLKEQRQIFHTQDLMVLWSMFNKNTLYTTIKRYLQKGVLYPIQKGLYSTVPIHQLDDWELGSRLLHHYSYISCETILFKEGYTNQPTNATTVISTSNKQFSLADTYTYRSRKLPARFLYNPTGVTLHNTVLVASPERAVADLLYFNPKAYFDWEINWKNIQSIQTQIGYPLTPQRYVNT